MIATANLAVMSTNGSEIIGAGVPPPGVTPNFENPSDNLRSVSYVTQTLTLVVVTAFVIVRFYAKHVALGNHWHTEDCTSLCPPHVLFAVLQLDWTRGSKTKKEDVEAGD